MFFIIYLLLSLGILDAHAEVPAQENPSPNTNVEEPSSEEWLELAQNYYWFAIEDHGNMDLFARAKEYLAKGISSQYNSIDCAQVMQAKQTNEPDIMPPPTSWDLVSLSLPYLRNPEQIFSKNPPIEEITADPKFFAIASDICFQEDIAHDTLGGVFPMTRFLKDSLFVNPRAYGIYEIIDNPAVMASTSATEKLIADIERTLPDESNFAVVVTSYPQDTALENEAYFIFNQNERFYNYPSADQNKQLQGLAAQLLGNQTWNDRRGSWKEQKAILKKLDASAILWHHIEQQKTTNGDAFYITHTRVIGHNNRDYVMKHMGFSLNRTSSFWWGLGTTIVLYALIFGYFVLRIEKPDLNLERNSSDHNPSRWDLWNLLTPKGKKISSLYTYTLIFISPLFGFFAYLFLASILDPLYPSLENLWFVSFWWPIMAFLAIFISPILVYWPLKSRLGNIISYDFEQFFPIFSFLALFGSSLHLINDSIFILDGEYFVIFMVAFAFQIRNWTILINNNKLLHVSISLICFSLLYLTMLWCVIIVPVVSMVLISYSYKQKTLEKQWTQKLWRDYSFLDWEETIDKTIQEIQRKKYRICFENKKDIPSELFFESVQQKITDNKNHPLSSHFIIPLEEITIDIFDFPHMAFRVPISLENFDPEKDKKSIFNSKLEKSVFAEQKTFFVYISNYQFIDDEVKSALETYIDDVNNQNTARKIFFITATEVISTKSAHIQIPQLDWEDIKDSSKKLLSKDILEWIEIEAQKEANNGDKKPSFNFLIDRVKKLTRNYQKKLKDFIPGEGSPMDFVKKGYKNTISCTNIPVEIEFENTIAPFFDEKYKNNKIAEGTAILLCVFFHAMRKIHDNNHVPSYVYVEWPKNPNISLSEYCEQYMFKPSETREYTNIPFEAIKYAIKQTLHIKSHDIDLKDLLEYFSKHKHSELDTLLSSLCNDEFSTKTPFVSLCIQACSFSSKKNEKEQFEESILKSIQLYDYQQNPYIMEYIIDIVEYFTDKKELFTDKKELVLEIKILLEKMKEYDDINKFCKELCRLFKNHPNQTIGQRTWSKLFVKFYQRKKKLDIKENSDFSTVIKYYTKENKDIWNNLYEKKTSTTFFLHNIQFHKILIENNEDSSIIVELEPLLKKINQQIQTEESTTDKNNALLNELNKLSIRIRNKIYRLNMKDETIEKKIDILIKDRKKYEPENIDNDYALYRDFYIAHHNQKKAIDFGLKALEVSLMKIKNNTVDLFVRKKEVLNIYMALFRCASIWCSLKNKDQKTNLQIKDCINIENLKILFPQTETSKIENMSFEEFLLDCLRGICTTTNITPTYLFSPEETYQAAAYLYIFDKENHITLKNNAVRKKIKENLKQKSQDFWFTSVEGIIKENTDDPKEYSLDGFTEWLGNCKTDNG